MKAGLIGAVAIGGAVVAALVWTQLAPFGLDAPGGRLADAPAPEAGSVGAPQAAQAPARDTAGPTSGRDGATSDGGAPAPAPESDGAATEAAPGRPADVAPGAGVSPDPRPGTAAREPAPPDEPSADLRAPSFDVVRVDADGQTVIAGRTGPHERVEIMLDGRVVETAQADPGGRFVAVLSTERSATARELRLRVTLPEPLLPAGPEATHGVTSGQGSAARSPEASPGPDGAAAPGAALSGPAPPPASRAGAPPATGRQRALAAVGAPPGPASPAAPAGQAADAEGAGAAEPTPPSAGDPSPQAGSAAAPGAPSPPAGSPAVPPSATGRHQGTPPPSAPPSAGAQGPAGDPAGGGHLLSDAVIILPTERAGDAPAIVRVQDEQLALLQPGGAAPTGVVLDQLTQQPDGDLLLRGRARPGHAVRIYGNGRALDTVAVADGGWMLTVPDARAGDIRLFRLDEIARSGAVASRVEVPFQPSDAASHVVRDRKITVRRGDNLWRIAEQHYGDGIRYSLIFGANGDLIRDPDLIYPDQVFTVPELVEAE